MRAKRTHAEVTAEREAKDYQRAFKGSENPQHCPVRIDKNRLNKHGNVCGLDFRKDKPPERIESESGDVLTWRCASGHIFNRTAPSAPLSRPDRLELATFRQYLHVAKEVGPVAAEAVVYRGAELLDFGPSTRAGAN